MIHSHRDRDGTYRTVCANCGRRLLWWQGKAWKHAAGGSQPQPKCQGAKPAPELQATTAEGAARMMAAVS